jgi:GcrA cell cycle regulator
MIETSWTMERIALLKDRVCAGFSCGQIARELGVSRNAVIGKTNRLGLSRFKNAVPGHSNQGRHNGGARPQTVGQRELQALWASSQLAFTESAEEHTTACSLCELAQWQCRWPLGDPSSANFGFCGNKAVPGLPYCPAHAQMAYRPRTRSALAREQGCPP